MLNKFLKKFKENGEIYLRIKVLPKATKDEIKDILEDDTIKINIKEKAEKGKANKSLIKIISHEFGVSSDRVVIINGSSSRLKLIKIINIK